MSISGAFRNGLVILSLTLAAVVAAQPAGAETSAREFIQPVLTHQQFTALVRDLTLTHDQRMIIELLLADYQDAVESVIARADADADAVGRQTVVDAFAGRVVVDPAELRRLREHVMRAYEPYLGEGAALLGEFITGVQSMLDGAQRRDFDAALPDLRRQLFLHPRHLARTSYEYAGEGVDVLRLLAEARAEGGELDRLREADVAEIIQRYRTQIDELIQETSLPWLRAQHRRQMAGITRQDEAAKEAERAVLELWRLLYDVNLRTVERIAHIADAQLGPDAADAWRERFENEAWAWLFTRSTPDRQYDWLARQRLGDEQRQQIDAVYADYQTRRRELAREVIAVMIRARNELGAIIYPMMDPSELRGGVARVIYEELLRKSGEMASLESATSGKFESALDENQRISFRRAIRTGPGPGRR